MNIVSNSITGAYLLALDVLNSQEPTDSRLGEAKGIVNACITIKNPYTRHIIEHVRKHNMKYVVTEIMWYLSGKRYPDMVAAQAPTWNKIKNYDGTVNSNYGDKIFYQSSYGRTQFERTLAELKHNIHSRRAFVYFNMYPEDYSLMSAVADFPCTLSGQFIMNNGKLDFIVTMRSNDLIYGWCNDVPWFTLLQEMMATLLGVPVGEYHHNAGSLHIYKRFYKYFKALDYIDGPITHTAAEQTPFAPMQQQDVNALLRQDYTVETPFMNTFTAWLGAGCE